jgi:hypothetical protein
VYLESKNEQQRKATRIEYWGPGNTRVRGENAEDRKQKEESGLEGYKAKSPECREARP